MNEPLRKLSGVVVIMIVTLMAATAYIQTIQAPALNADGRNVRTIYREYGKNRGPIVVAGTSIVTSVPVRDPFKYQRSYVSGTLYGHVTGFFSIANGSTEIESKENAFLNGTAPALWLDRLSGLLTGAEPQGSSVELTLDPAVQKTAYDALGNQRGAVVAIEPSTGKILALVSTPGYDPNALASHNTSSAAKAYQGLLKADGSPLENRAIRGRTYPPGSTFKLVTSAAALESGDYTKDSVIPAPHRYQLPQSKSFLRNYGDVRCSPSGQMTLAEALTVSCNTAYAELGVRLGAEKLAEQAEAFGFDTPLSIPLTVAPSHVDADANPPMTALAAIGQGNDRATPLQIAMVSAAIANRGELMKPYVVQTIRGANLDVVQDTKPNQLRRSVSPQTAAQLTDMMIDVVDRGSGTGAQISGIDVAGKTGTAETSKNVPPHAWFTGFAPANDPKVAVAVIVEQGGSLGSEATGGKIAAPIAKAVMEAVLRP